MEAAAAADVAATLSAEEEALLAEALPSAPEEHSLPSSLAEVAPYDLTSMEYEDRSIRERTARAMASLDSERAELREMLTPRGTDADAADAGRAARQRALDEALKEATAHLASWVPDLDSLCEPSLESGSVLPDVSDGVGGVGFFLTEGDAVDVGETDSHGAMRDALEAVSPARASAAAAAAAVAAAAAASGAAVAEPSKREGLLEGSRREGLMADLASRDEERSRMISALMKGGGGGGGAADGSSSRGGGCGGETDRQRQLLADLAARDEKRSRMINAIMNGGGSGSGGETDSEMRVHSAPFSATMPLSRVPSEGGILSGGGRLSRPSSSNCGSRPGSSCSSSRYHGVLGGGGALTASAPGESSCLDGVLSCNGVGCNGQRPGSSCSSSGSRPASSRKGTARSGGVSSRGCGVSDAVVTGGPSACGGGEGPAWAPFDGSMPPAIHAVGLSHPQTRPYPPAHLPTQKATLGASGASSSSLGGCLGGGGLAAGSSRSKLTHSISERDATAQSNRAAAEMISSRRLRNVDRRALSR